MYRVRYLQPADPRLGRHVNHDPRSRSYPVREAAPIVSVQHERHIPIFDQGDLGSCTGNAGIGCLGTGPFYTALANAWEPSYYLFDESGAVSCYGDATRADSYAGAYPPDDTGSDGLSVAKVLKAKGEISGYQHAFSLGQGLQALMTRPVIVGVDWMQDMFSPDAEGIVHPTGALAGGHEFVWDGYDKPRGLCWFTNSWGGGWSVGGRFAMPAEEFGTLLARDGDVTAFVPITAPAPTPDPVPAPPAPADDADRALWSGNRDWAYASHVGSNRHAAVSMQVWAKVKGMS
jgi:hypothetical protein